MLRTMAHGLVRQGITIDVVTTDDNGTGRLDVPLGEPVVEDGVTYWYFPRQTRFYAFSFPLTRWLAEHVKDYDLLHIHALFSYATIPAAYWAKRLNIPYIVRPLGVLNRWGMTNRRAWLKKLSFSLIESRILSGAAAIHFTSEQEELEAAELGVSGRPIIIPNPVDVPPNVAKTNRGKFRARHPEVADRTLILFLSRLDRKKGLDLLLPAFADVRATGLKAALIIAGDGEPTFVESLKEDAVRLGIVSDVFWAGFLTGEEKWSALADADLFVLPSYSENFGISLVEAMTFAVPVIVSDQVAIHREVSAAKAGLVIPCRHQDLVVALAQLISDANLRLRMGSNGQRLVETELSPKIAWRRSQSLYRQLLETAESEATPRVVTEANIKTARADET